MFVPVRLSSPFSARQSAIFGGTTRSRQIPKDQQSEYIVFSDGG